VLVLSLSKRPAIVFLFAGMARSYAGEITETGLNMSERQEGGARLHQGAQRRGSAVGGAPLISIITVACNAVQHLPDTLESIRSQDYRNFEWIVIDGGSTDGTTEFLRAHEDVIDYWLSEPDRGMYDALAKGFERAGGEIVCWLNAGDLLLDGALAIVAEVFQAHPEINWLTGMHFWHLPGRKIIGCHIPPAYSSDLIVCGAYGRSLPYIQQESTFFRRSMLEVVDMKKFRGYRLAGDLYLWSCFAGRDRLVLACAGLGSFCIHEGQLSEDKQAYWQEAETFLKRTTLAAWIKIMLRMPLKYAPIRIKKWAAGDVMLTWVKGGGWQ
jgi:glycosyltransferase involved in cell wall biosynthesis